MIFVKIYGGLGNQIFQLAKALEIKAESNCEIVINQDFMTKYSTVRKLELTNIFSLPDYIKIESSNNLANFLFRFRLLILLNKFFNYLGINFDQLNFCKSTYLDGYYQNFINLNNYEYIINQLRIFYLSGNKCNILFDDNICTMHIRGGDFLLSKNHEICGLEYYKNAINKIYPFHNVTKIKIITDDVNHSRSIIIKLEIIFPFIEFFICDSNGYKEDFEIIRISKFKIIGNSTFAWWASALGSNNAVIFSPSKWSKTTCRTFFLPSEICIET